MMHKKIVGEFQPISLNRDQSDCLTAENTKECTVDTLQSVGLRMLPPSTERARLRSALCTIHGAVGESGTDARAANDTDPLPRRLPLSVAKAIKK